MDTQTDLLQPSLSVCACANLRKAARAVTHLFDRTFQPSGLRITQFSILALVYSSGSETINRLAEKLVLDRTTLTRDLKPLERKGLVKIAPGEDRRTRVITLTKRGAETLVKALPLWKRAQACVIEGLGEGRLRSLLTDLSDTVEMTKGI